MAKKDKWKGENQKESKRKRWKGENKGEGSPRELVKMRGEQSLVEEKEQLATWGKW